MKTRMARLRGTCLGSVFKDDNFSAVSGELESPEQTELARILKLELQSFLPTSERAHVRCK